MILKLLWFAWLDRSDFLLERCDCLSRQRRDEDLSVRPIEAYVIGPKTVPFRQEDLVEPELEVDAAPEVSVAFQLASNLACPKKEVEELVKDLEHLVLSCGDIGATGKTLHQCCV